MKPEDRFVERLRALLPATDAVHLGPGDDAAILAREAGLLAATTDMLVEGVDFLSGEDPERLGRRAASLNLSDLAAVGAQPEFFLLSIGLPAERGEEYALGIARGAIARAAEFGTHLVGGDLSAASQIIVSIALWGRPVDAPLRRAGSSPGQDVYVSGFPGQAAAGLRMARRLAAFAEQGAAPTHRFPEIAREDQDRLLRAFHDPDPRVKLGLELARRQLATSAIDVSDGLGVDAGRLARASGVRIVIEHDLLPISPSLISFASMDHLDPVDLALSGGDDYELLFTVAREDASKLDASTSAFGVPVRRIGRVEAGEGAVLRDSRGDRPIADLGHDHFEERR